MDPYYELSTQRYLSLITPNVIDKSLESRVEPAILFPIVGWKFIRSTIEYCIVLSISLYKLKEQGKI